MASASKVKGDRAEREAVQALIDIADGLTVENPMRMLGAGRKDDIGDIRVFPDVTIQVRAYANLATGLRSASDDAIVQAERAGTPFAIGMVPIPHARASSPNDVRWLVSCADWPNTDAIFAKSFARTNDAVTWLRGKKKKSPPPSDSRFRIAIVERKGQKALIVTPLQAWVDAYRFYRTNQTDQIEAIEAPTDLEEVEQIEAIEETDRLTERFS